MENGVVSGFFTASCIGLSLAVYYIKRNAAWGWAVLMVTIIIDHWVDHFVAIMEKW